MDSLASANISAWKELISTRELVLDGGMATSLESDGYDLSGTLWSAQLLLDNPAAIEAVHLQHALAGADVLTTSAYQISRQGFIAAGRTVDDSIEAIETSTAIARSAAAQCLAISGRTVFVAASVGPYGAVLADGSEYRGDYNISRQELLDFHSERLHDIVATEPDILAFETIPSAMELSVINELLTTTFTSIPAWVSVSAQDQLRISDGTHISDAFELLDASPIVAMGINCTKPEYIADLLLHGSSVHPERARIVYSNAGRTWDALNRIWLDEAGQTLPTETIKDWRKNGARLIGGCCGLGEPHITAVTQIFSESSK
jgi:homocysteine S-methyltransferase